MVGPTRWAMALFLLAAPLAAAGDSRAAVVLYDPPPTYPTAAAGSEISPEATVRVVVDAQGRVSDVDVIRIDPASPFDGTFRRVLVDTFRRWRFAPKIENGEPAPTELQWTTKLQAPDRLTPPSRAEDHWDRLLGTSTGEETSYLELPFEQRVKLLEQQVRVGHAAFGGETVHQHSSDWFVVNTAADPDVAAAIANNLAATYRVLYLLFADQIPLQEERLKMQVFAYRSPQQLEYLEDNLMPDESSAEGFYSSLGLIGMHLQLPTPDMALAMLLHEGTHAFIDRHVVRPGVQLPYWLAEGLAEYMANSTIRKRQLVPGKIPRGRRVDVRMIQGRLVRARWDTGTSMTLAQIKRAAKQGDTPSLDQMLDANLAEFTGEKLGLYYGMSWLLVHYLRHGREGWADVRFPRFLLYVAEGYPVVPAFETVYGSDFGELEDGFRHYIAEF